jgi:hypothetical protein
VGLRLGSVHFRSGSAAGSAAIIEGDAGFLDFWLERVAFG